MGSEHWLIFNFDSERARLNFALTIRILRTRDPALDVETEGMEVVFSPDDDEAETVEEQKTFNKIVGTQHYNIEEMGIPVVFSVSDLHLYQKLHSTSRHVY